MTLLPMTTKLRQVWVGWRWGGDLGGRLLLCAGMRGGEGGGSVFGSRLFPVRTWVEGRWTAPLEGWRLATPPCCLSAPCTQTAFPKQLFRPAHTYVHACSSLPLLLDPQPSASPSRAPSSPSGARRPRGRPPWGRCGTSSRRTAWPATTGTQRRRCAPVCVWRVRKVWGRVWGG